MKFSIVIPVYNAEKYIGKTLQSICHQTYTDFEVIIVDDGSTDASMDICNSVAKKDSRFTLIRKDNAGVSATRNMGIEKASGDYIIFIDSDDWIEENTLEINDAYLEETQADQIIFGMSFDIEKNNSVKKSIIKTHDKETIYSDDFARVFKKLYDCNYLTSSCNRAVSSRILKEHNLRFNERISNYEDYEFVLRVLSYTKCIMVIPDVLYHYAIRHDKSNSRKYKTNMRTQLPEICRVLLEDVKKLTFDEKPPKEIHLTIQEVFWAGINNLCKGPKPVSNIRDFCGQKWISEMIPMMMTGNMYNDVSVRLYNKGHWFLLYLWNRLALVIRTINY